MTYLNVLAYICYEFKMAKKVCNYQESSLKNHIKTTSESRFFLSNMSIE